MAIPYPMIPATNKTLQATAIKSNHTGNIEKLLGNQSSRSSRETIDKDRLPAP
jgi:hypothetical protein